VKHERAGFGPRTRIRRCIEAHTKFGLRFRGVVDVVVAMIVVFADGDHEWVAAAFALQRRASGRGNGMSRYFAFLTDVPQGLTAH
jgi:hypothetical protein